MIDYERQAITSTARLPRRPGPSAVKVYCRCGNWIGERDDGWVFTVYRGRRQTSPLPTSIECEKCHRSTELTEH